METQKDLPLGVNEDTDPSSNPQINITESDLPTVVNEVEVTDRVDSLEYEVKKMLIFNISIYII